MRRLASTAAVLTLLLAAGCGGADDAGDDPGAGASDSATPSDSSSPSESDDASGSEEPSPSETETEAATLPEPPVCEGLPALSEYTGRGEPVELAAGDAYPLGGEALVPTCYQQGPRGSVEIGLYADAAEGREMMEDIEGNRLMPGTTECVTPDVDGTDLPEGLVASLCQVPEHSPIPIPAAVYFGVPLGDGFVQCIAAAVPGERELTERLGDLGARACVASILSLGQR